MTNAIIQAADDNTARVQSWVHIDDFSPGIFDSSYVSTAEPIISAPIGAANAGFPFACASIIGGALGPLPALAQQESYGTSFPGGSTHLYVTGFAVNPILTKGDTELVIMLEADNGSKHYYLVDSVIAETNTVNSILNITNTTTPGFFGAEFPSWTRMSLQPVEGGSGYILPTPVLVWPGAVATDSHGGDGHIYVYPNPGNPSAFAPADIVVVGSSGVAGPIYCYGNRVLVMQPQGATWPVGGGVVSNENIGYTDPPQSYDYPINFGADIPNDTILAAESPFGYGAWGSTSVGEAIFIKNYGGAVVLNGDIAAPSSIIPLPSVQSTGGFSGLACSTTVGLIYCSQNEGAWSWNGGNVAQKISPQLDDDFFNAQATGGVVSDTGYGFLVERWQDWILFSNNYLYNPDTGGWWILYPNQSQTSTELFPLTFYWFKQGRSGNEMYAAPLVLSQTSASTRQWYNKFDNTVPTTHWQWQSLPIHVVPTADRVVDVRQVIVRLSNPDGSTATATVTVGTESQTTDTTIGPNPTTFRFNFGIGALGLQDIVITINGDSTGSAPILHSLDIGYNIVASMASAN